MNPAEVAQPLLPVQTTTGNDYSTNAYRDGVFGEARPSLPYGKQLVSYDNGIFGQNPSALGAVAETAHSVNAYRDGIFDYGGPAEAPVGYERLTAFHDGTFGMRPMGADNGGMLANIEAKYIWIGAAALALGVGIALYARKR